MIQIMKILVTTLLDIYKKMKNVLDEK